MPSTVPPYGWPQGAGVSIPTHGDGRRARIGLLGGSFNPGHLWHRAIARRALAVLGLDQVWLMVSPGNPLKAGQDMAGFGARMATARALADGRRVVATDIEARLGSRYTVDTVRLLKRRFPHVRFVWLMGADGLATLPRWKRWRVLVHDLPIAVFPRPGQNAPALNGAAGRAMARWRVPARGASGLALLSPPAWAFLAGAQNSISATAIRKRGGFPAGARSTAGRDGQKTGEQS